MIDPQVYDCTQSHNELYYPQASSWGLRNTENIHEILEYNTNQQP